MGDRAEKTAFAQITRRRMTQDGNFNFWAVGVPKEQGRSKQGVGDANWVEYLHRGTFVVEELLELPTVLIATVHPLSIPTHVLLTL